MGKKHKCPPAGAPAWMATFADMMTLLMAFFIMLLSLAEMNAEKYLAVAGELKRALGVKVDSKIPDLPGEKLKEMLADSDVGKKCTPSDCEMEAEAERRKLNAEYDKVEQRLMKLAADHDLVIEKLEHQIVIRIQEQGVFQSGSDRISSVFEPKIIALRQVLEKLDGGIKVAGHTDDIPIQNGRFVSNWALSSARAVAVVHELMREGTIDQGRISAVGYADSRPLVPNVDNESRQINRRVEVILTAERDLGGVPTAKKDDGADGEVFGVDGDAAGAGTGEAGDADTIDGVDGADVMEGGDADVEPSAEPGTDSGAEPVRVEADVFNGAAGDGVKAPSGPAADTGEEPTLPVLPVIPDELEEDAP